VIYSIGTVQLSVVAGISLIKAVMVGVAPFLLGEVIKLAAAAWLVHELRKRLQLAR
ncbi:MAG: biotin transporter BioY, partial [Syntrophomonadaceae bacterium]|nr:biotin transporter BioY [Syntrophomonadaceae bacterium]